MESGNGSQLEFPSDYLRNLREASKMGEYGSNVTKDIQGAKVNDVDCEMMCPCHFVLGCFAVRRDHSQ